MEMSKSLEKMKMTYWQNIFPITAPQIVLISLFSLLCRLQSIAHRNHFVWCLSVQ